MNTVEGLVVRVDARQCDVEIAGEMRAALMRGRLFENRGIDKMPIAVGDRVMLHENGDELAIQEGLPRDNLFARRVTGEETRRQLLAVNVDQVVIVACFGTPPFSSITTDRILAACSFASIPAVLVLNKSDKAKRGKRRRVMETYQTGGFKIIETSAADETGIDDFADVVRGKRSVLYGLSGVGKSSLLNLIESGLGLKTREISKSLKSGRHTTTFARLYHLEMGGSVIDTPGVRAFRPHGIPSGELRLHWPEFAELGRECDYDDCTHRHEPGCKVTAAVDADEIAASRYRSYESLLCELEEIEANRD
ncbi:MAG: ribosome small subunit-dependent GTPase A [Planctomycetes bacterium]|nr:ribosome small subunit-dependent GTPase A [Planctomycetota bacterium]